MICLSLRISGEKSTDRSKLMDQRVEEIKAVVNNLVESYEEGWLISVGQADTLKDQIAVVTKVTQEFVQRNNPSDVNILKILMELYLKLSSINPLKKYILSSLSELNEDLVNILNEIVMGIIVNRFDKVCTFDDSDEFVSLLNFINSCFNRSNDSFFVVCECSNILFVSAKDIIASCSSFLSDSSVTPVFKEMMLKNIHSISQGIITFLHKVTAECLPPIFLPSCLEYLADDNLPLNTKTNFAIIIGLVNQLSHTYSWEMLIQKFTSTAPITLVSLCSGIFSAASTSLWLPLDSGQYLSNYLLDQLLELEAKNSSDCKLVLGVSRGLSQYTKALLTADIGPSDNDLYLEKVLSYLWIHLEHPMDAVRHLSSESLSNIVSFGHKHTDSDVNSRIMKEVINIPLYRRSKYVILSSLVGHIPIDVLLKEVPNLVEILLLSVKESSGAKHVVVSFEKLVSQHYTELEDKSEWLHIWVDPLISCLNKDSTPVLEHILCQVIRIDPTVINYILGLDDKLYCNKVKIILLSLRVSQKVGVLKGNSDVKWKGFIEYSFLESCLHHREREARLSLFGLIVDSPKSSELFTVNELEIVKTFLKYNVNCQSASFRQCFIALFKKFLQRIHDSHNHHKCSPRHSDDSTLNNHNRPNTSDKCQKACYYFQFLDWLLGFCCDQLFPGSSFSRRSTVLNMLNLVFSYNFCDRDIFTKKMAHRLLYIIQVDTYEENKRLAKEVIQKLEFDLLSLYDEKKIYEAFNDCLTFASSIRPPDCISAAYCLSSLLKFNQVQQVFCDLAGYSKNLLKDDVKLLGIYYCLSLLVDDLSTKADVATRNIHQAAKEGPMYGLLFLIRHILHDVDFIEISGDKYWMDLIKNLIKIGIQCTKAVGCIVNNSSPEGHLPMDLSIDVSSLTLADGSHQATSQLLLLCSWRTVKEVCLLFGEIVEKIEIHEEDDGIHFSVKDVLVIGDHLTTLLSEIKHRGAFEQAYIGFCKLASTLWKYPKGHLHELPSIWLKETLEEITSSESKLCATRRSAGIPFIIQALVVTEREVLGGKQLGWTVRRVLELGRSTTESWETRVHSMNILRSLYRSSLLGEAISPFVAAGFIISFKGFSGQTWSERNSATLLFSALITRVFGVNRSRSNCLSWKNKMTGRIFFQRYPELYSVIMSKLKECSESDIHSIFPVLLLLSRLYPSSLEGSDSNLRLENMIPFITKCGGSQIMKIRSLAASALVGLIYPFKICDQITCTIDSIDNSTPENNVHGNLLQVLQLLKSGPEIPNSNSTDFHQLINSWMKSIIIILLQNKHSFITKSVCLNIIFQLMLKYFNYLSEENLNNFRNIIYKNLFYSNNLSSHKSIGLSQYLEFNAILYLFLYFKKYNDDFGKCVLELFSHGNCEIFHIVVDSLCCVLTSSEADSEEICQYVEYFDVESTQKLKLILESSDKIHEILIKKIKEGVSYPEDSVKLMSLVKELPLIIKKMSDEEREVIDLLSEYDLSENLRASVLTCLSSYLMLNGTTLNENECDFLCKIMSESIKSDFDCRMALSELLLNNYKLLIDGYPSAVVFSTLNAIVHLMCDDTEEIRVRMSDILNEKVDCVIALEKCFHLFSMIIKDKFVFACALVAWSIGPFCEEPYNLEENDKAFDKGDMNSFKEDVTLTTICCQILKQIFSKYPELFIQEIPSDVHTWLDDYTGFSSSCKTLKELLHCFDEYIENICGEQNGKYSYFVNFSTTYKNYSLLNEKNDKIIC